MLPDRVSNPGPLTYESGALPTALRGPATSLRKDVYIKMAELLLLKSVPLHLNTRIPWNAVSRLSVLCYKTELNIKTRQKFTPLLTPGPSCSKHR